jgi:selenocysteine lyase/cysteine desulfurase
MPVTMDRTAETAIAAKENTLRDRVLELLRARNKKARFVTELYASLGRLQVGAADADRVLAELEAAGIVMVREHFCADPHLADVDLRVVALVERNEGEDPQMDAIRRIDETWNKWLNEYLANHRCG